MVQIQPPVRQKGGGIRQYPLLLKVRQSLLLPVQAVKQALGHTFPASLQGPQQFRHVRYGDFRRIGRRRCPPVGHKVADGHVRLMPHGGDDGDLRVIDGPGHPLIVEGPQVLQRASAAAGDEHIRQVVAVCIADGAHDLRRCLHSLYPHWQQQHLGDGIPAAQDTDHVVYRRARRRSNNGDALGIAGQRLLVGRVEQPLPIQLIL